MIRLGYWGVCVVVIAMFGVGCSNDQKADKVLRVASEEINKQAPLFVDDITRVDSSAVLPGKRLRYYYTIFDVLESELPLLKEFMKRNTLEMVRSSDDMKGLKDLDITLEYYYKNEKGTPLFDIVLTPSDYNVSPDMSSDEYVYGELKELVAAKSKQLPIVFDDSVSLIKIEVEKPRTVVHTVVCSTFIPTESFDSIQFKDFRKGFMVDESRENVFTTLLPEAGVIYKYIYKGKDDKYLCTLVITPDEYRKK